MKFVNLSQLISQNIRRNRKNLAFSTIGIVVGICSFVFFITQDRFCTPAGDLG